MDFSNRYTKTQARNIDREQSSSKGELDKTHGREKTPSTKMIKKGTVRPAAW